MSIIRKKKQQKKTKKNPWLMLTEKSTLNNNRVKWNNQKFPIMLQVLSAVYR